MKLKLNFKNKNISLEVKKLNWFGRISGLMFTRRKKAEALLFDFIKPVKIAIHSFFVFFPFYAIWLDNKNKIIEIKKVSPWRPFILPSRKYIKLVEIPINEKYSEIINSLSRVRKV